MRPTPTNPSSGLDIFPLPDLMVSPFGGGGLSAFSLNDIKAQVDNSWKRWLVLDARQQKLGAFPSDLGAGNKQRCNRRTDMTQQIDVIKARYRKSGWNGPALPLTFQQSSYCHDVCGEENSLDGWSGLCDPLDCVGPALKA